MSLHHRPEAQPASWQQFTESQRQAFERMVALLSAATGRLQTPESYRAKLSPDSWVLPRHASGTAFLSGARGSGKTTALVTLVSAMGGADGIRAFEGDQSDQRPPAELIKRLGLLSRQLVWLEPIDMEPSPRFFHPLSAMLARVEQAVGRSAGSSGQGRNALQKLGELQRHVALSWEWDRQIEGSEGLSNFVHDVQEIERSRLNLARSTSDILEEAALAIEGPGGIHNPLFVQPIDDFDLAPRHCLRLLRYLRMAWVPRLFFLVLGDLRVAEAAVHVQLSGDLADLFGRGSEKFLSVAPQRVAAISGEVAANALRKLIAPSQRVELRHSTISDTLRYRPFSDGWQTTPSIEQLLARNIFPLRLVLEPGKMTLLTFLVPDRAGIGNAHRYRGSDVLRAGPRRLVDLWHSLSEATEIKADLSSLIDVVAGYLYGILSEDPVLAQDPEQRTLKQIKRTSSDHWVLGTPGLYVEATFDGWAEVIQARIPLPEAGADSKPASKRPRTSGEANRRPLTRSELVQYELRAYRPEDWSFIDYRDDRRSALEARVTSESASALVVLHDLLASDPDRSPTESPFLDETIEFAGWARTVWHTHSELIEFNWPAPSFRTFWAYDRFLGSWQRALSQNMQRPQRKPGRTDPEESRVGATVFAWVPSGLSGFVEIPSDDFNHILATQRIEAVLSFKARISNSAFGPDCDRWWLSLGLLAFPEYLPNKPPILTELGIGTRHGPGDTERLIELRDQRTAEPEEFLTGLLDEWRDRGSPMSHVDPRRR